VCHASAPQGRRVEVPSFPELEAAIAAAIGELGGAVCPKLNWSAPKVGSQKHLAE
jgi:hypothetical protein